MVAYSPAFFRRDWFAGCGVRPKTMPVVVAASSLLVKQPRRRVLVALAVAFSLLCAAYVYGGVVERVPCAESFPNLAEPDKTATLPKSRAEIRPGSAAAIPDTFAIEEADFCRRRKPTLIVCVNSAISRQRRRQETRQTWTKVDARVAVVFVVGLAKTTREEVVVREESSLYGDIVQGNYTDTYDLLTYKTLNALHWVGKNCPDVPWFMHADDDIMVDTYLVMDRIAEFDAQRRTNEFFCRSFDLAPVERRGKWAMTRSEYPCSAYPTYCNGPGWFASTGIVDKLLRSVPYVKLICLEDVYVTGMVAQRAGVARTRCAGMTVANFRATDVGKVLIWMNVKGSRAEMWEMIQRHHARGSRRRTKS